MASIDLFPNVGEGTLREASVQRHKEKQRTNLISKKIGGQVRKGNCDQRPRMKANVSLISIVLSIKTFNVYLFAYNDR